MEKKLVNLVSRQVSFYKPNRPLFDVKYQWLMIDSLYGCRLLFCPFNDFKKTCKTCIYSFRTI